MNNQEPVNVTIVIDVFRAFTTAGYVLKQHPKKYFLTNQCVVIEELANQHSDALLIGKPEIGSSLHYDFPNSPTHAQKTILTNKTICHRTQAGATGILQALATPSQYPHRVFAGSFANAEATVAQLWSLNIHQLTLMPMGHEANEPSIEDELCADYIRALINHQSLSLEPHRATIQQSSGRYFFDADQWQYPKTDFELCLATSVFDFAIEAIGHGHYAELVPVHTIAQDQSLLSSAQQCR